MVQKWVIERKHVSIMQEERKNRYWVVYQLSAVLNNTFSFLFHQLSVSPFFSLLVFAGISFSISLLSTLLYHFILIVFLVDSLWQNFGFVSLFLPIGKSFTFS